MASANRPPSLADKGVTYVLGLNVIVGVVAIIVFSYLRWRYQNNKSRDPSEDSARARGGKDPPPTEPTEETGLLKERPKGESFMGFILPLLLMTPHEHLERIGYDAMLYFYFQRAVIVFLAVCLIFGMAVLPVNYFGGKNLEGFLSTTVANVKDSGLYWVHALVTVLFSLSLYIFLWHLRSYALSSHDLLLDRYQSVKSAVSVHSIWIRNFPRDCLNVTIIKTHFEELFANNFQFRRLLEEARAEKRQGTEEEWEEEEEEQKGAMKMAELAKRRKHYRHLEKEGGSSSSSSESDSDSSDNDVIPEPGRRKEETENDVETTDPVEGPPTSSGGIESRKKVYEQTVSDGELYILGRRQTVTGLEHLRRNSVSAGRGEDEAGDDIETGLRRPSSEKRRGKGKFSSKQRVKRRSNTIQPRIITQNEGGPVETGDVGPHKWTEIDFKKTHEEVGREVKIRRQREKLLYKEVDGGVVSITIVPELKDVIYYSELYQDACNKLAHYKNLAQRNGFRPRISCSPSLSFFGWLQHKLLCKGDVDAIMEYKALKKETYLQMETAKRNMNKLPSAGVVFATFSSYALAKEVLNFYNGEYTSWKSWLFGKETLTRYSTLLKDKQWFVRMAPEPEDIIWKNLGISRNEKRLRVLIVNVILLAFFSFFTTPLGIVSTLQNLFGYATNSLGTLLGSAGGFLVAYIPTIVLLLFTFLLPMMIWVSSVPEGHQTISITHKWLVVKTYLYFLFNILILPSLFLTSIDALIEKTWLNRHQLWTILDVEKFLPFSSAFLICYVLNMAVVGCCVEILRVVERLQYLFFKWRAVTKEEHEAADNWAFPHEYGMEYAYMVVIFSTTFAYAPVVPLFIPAGMFYFVCKHFVDSYHLVHVRPINFKSDGSMLWLVLQAVLITSTISQSGVALFLLLHGSFGQFFIVALLPIMVLMTQLYVWVSGQQSLFQYPHKKRQQVVLANTNWIETFRLAYVHDILQDEHQRQLQAQLEEDRRKQEEAENQLHSTETRRRLLRRSSMSFGTFSPLKSTLSNSSLITTYKNRRKKEEGGGEYL